MSDDILSPMQFRFVEEYIRDSSSAKKAAIRAGYSLDTSSQIASRLLKDPKIQKAIKEAQNKGMKTCGITAEMVIQELALIAFAKPGDLVRVNSEGEAEVDLNDLSKGSGAGSEVVINMINSGGRKSKSVSVKAVTTAAKLDALKTLAKIQGISTEKVEVTHTQSLKDLIETSFESDSDVSEPETIN